MKRAIVLSGLVLVSIVFAVVIYDWDNASIRNNDDAALFCQPEALYRLALADSGQAQMATEPGCGLVTASHPVGSNAVTTAVVINMHQQLESVYISGVGFGVSTGLDVSIRLQTQGIITAPYSMRLVTDDTGRFTTDSLKIMCPEPDTKLLVMAIDQAGISHARVFESGEFRC